MEKNNGDVNGCFYRLCENCEIKIICKKYKIKINCEKCEIKTIHLKMF